MIWRASDQFLHRLQNRINVDGARKQPVSNFDPNLRKLLVQRIRITAEQQHLHAFAPCPGVHALEDVGELRCTAVTNNEVRVLCFHPTCHEHQRYVAHLEATSSQGRDQPFSFGRRVAHEHERITRRLDRRSGDG